jgi:hypothetical protein
VNQPRFGIAFGGMTLGHAFLATALACALAACATGVEPVASCKDCPTATLMANGDTMLSVAVGTEISYTWSSTNADEASSTVSMAPSADACGNMDGPWVVKTLQGSLPAIPLLPCQGGTTYTLELKVTQSSSGQSAASSVTIAVAAQ